MSRLSEDYVEWEIIFAAIFRKYCHNIIERRREKKRKRKKRWRRKEKKEEEEEEEEKSSSCGPRPWPPGPVPPSTVEPALRQLRYVPHQPCDLE